MMKPRNFFSLWSDRFIRETAPPAPNFLSTNFLWLITSQEEKFSLLFYDVMQKQGTRFQWWWCVSRDASAMHVMTLIVSKHSSTVTDTIELGIRTWGSFFWINSTKKGDDACDDRFKGVIPLSLQQSLQIQRRRRGLWWTNEADLRWLSKWLNMTVA